MSSMLKRKAMNDSFAGIPNMQKSQRTDEPAPINEPVACLHEVSYPEGYVPSRPGPSGEKPKPAKEFPFELDPFQREAINCLDNAESVMVSAHTSAGKTVVALYAIAMSLRDQQRVIYTSPIKALSNQKYRDFKEEFSDVGLMTGDVTIEPNASCLVSRLVFYFIKQLGFSVKLKFFCSFVVLYTFKVMTTEIWRSMLYKGSEVMREVAWIIFDEVHYMRDRERGVVWEESIVMAPKNSRFVFLSATVPNAKEFADWVAKVHDQPCHVVYTDYRPTPLQHYIFPSGGDGLYLVVDEKSKFKEDNFQRALNALVPRKEADKKRDIEKWQKALLEGNPSEDSDIFKLVKMLIQRQYDPVILFSFSKRECEFLALQMAKMDLNDDQEKTNIETIFWCAMDLLSDDDKKLPQASYPVIEVIEILFQEGLIKCLFATETFSIGLNMPAKTVVFTNVRKFDGDKFRWITSGEYIQMSGRAGRRGIDQRGICILMIDEKMEPSTAKMILKGSADCLNSAFHLSYNMLLNQLRCEDGDPEKLLRHSFYQFQADRALPDLEKQAKELEIERDSIVIKEEDSLNDYYDLLQQYKSLKQDVRDIVLAPKYSLPFLQPGRLVSLLNDIDDQQPLISTEVEVAWGVIVNFKKIPDPTEDKSTEDSKYTVDVLTKCVVKEEGSKKSFKIVHLKGEGDPVVISLPLSQIDNLSVIRVYMPKDLVPLEAREHMLKILSEVYSRFGNGIPLLDPEEDMKELMAKIKSIKKSMRSSTALAFKDELKARKRVLRRLGYITSEDVVKTKGKVACEITSADELTLTELMFSGAFKEISIEEMVALLSCFVWQERLQDARKPREELQLLFSQLQETARRVANVNLDCKVQVDVESFVNSFRFDIMEAVHAWTKGSKFFEIMEMSQVFEGSLIRAIRRLEEVLQQLALAAKSIGETDLEAKFVEAVAKIKRDIVFAASLYL
ncbi:hypothetical protein HPP92_013187 [Vanilla planifolia]|uniref:Superkiller viralicidic activity 2-like 2 n=1 Tax=Vanilla planifolia TaxID=51239 RepID=A0A835QV56_VANPL|nr:hypothetical protein HPP92_013187 [Vanilla planifolia]